jgi:hypothetical protein
LLRWIKTLKQNWDSISKLVFFVPAIKSKGAIFFGEISFGSISSPYLSNG